MCKEFAHYKIKLLLLLPDAGLVAHGVLQEVWHNINIKRGVISLQNDERFPNAPDVVTVHERFDVYDFDTKIYGQRLTAYLLVCVITLNTKITIMNIYHKLMLSFLVIIANSLISMGYRI